MDYSSNNVLVQMAEWLTAAENWSGDRGIPARVAEHLGYSALAVLLAAVVAVPLGLYVGHTGRGRVLIISGAGLLRALPTLGLVFLFVLLWGLGLMPPVWALVLLAVPPLLTGVYAGISSVDPRLVDAARAMGMTELQILFRVELPNGLRVIMGGVRAATLQVTATVAVVAFISLGGLGVFLVEGTQLRDNGRLFGGALLIAVTAVAVDAVLALGQRLTISPGLRTPHRTPTPSATPAAGFQGGNP
ncbi:Glycine betaine/carnitine/choline transport system permease protein OpuCB [Arthrobacter saudimassiliensis]|uniref:Glycine betaine/carnitine/choline transport system permease protein OpuCB n=1 Tax=Arthrobacter saudimassiliensis TaxID=1461584 RepID=A0A078MTN2_9MICC|nr:Glycine betaine/carnitine/choline transport system permease protein OpuCB [Arthrobacter saudimassiliensis]